MSTGTGYDFDEIIDRKNTDSTKHDFIAEYGKPERIIPLWVADMDFRSPNEVIQALTKRAEHGVFGYTDTKEGYFNALRGWFSKGFGFEIKPEWVVKTPGVVFAAAMAVRAFTEEGGAVLIQRPVYYPFTEVIEANGRRVVNSALVYEGGRYHVDLEDFERKITGSGARLFILCSPHNPVGRVWSAGELAAMGGICLKHGCRVLSDEIHCDFVYEGHKHHVFGSLNGDFLENSVICTAPSKTFNLAGLQASNIFIADGRARLAFEKEIEKTGYGSLNAMGLAACRAAYEHGAGWLCQLKEYFAGNTALIRGFLKERLPEVKLVEPEGTYLAWLDFTALGLSQAGLDALMTDRAGLWLDSGTMFGTEGAGFQRVNMACPRATLETALSRLESAVRGR